APRRQEPGRRRSGWTATDDENVCQVVGIYARTYRESTYAVGSGTPASTKASCRSRHLLHRPQWSGDGFMHDKVSAKSTPSATPRLMTSAFSIVANGASMRTSRARPSDSARAIADRNCGVASGNGLCASVPTTMRSIFAAAQNKIGRASCRERGEEGGGDGAR